MPPTGRTPPTPANETHTTEGGYVGSQMYRSGLNQAKQTFANAFGAAHILSHREWMVNTVSNGKPNGGLSWVGVIMGEFLVSKAGLGYLIVYGSQVFNMDLVMTSVLVLALAAVVMYLLVLRAEKFLNSVWGVRV